MDEFLAPGSIARCIARSEIESLLHHHASLATEDASAEKLQPLFTEDGVFKLPNGAVVNPGDILKITQGHPPKLLRHHLTTIHIEFVSLTEAHTEAFFLVVTHKSAADHSGRYKDIVVKGADGVWRIAVREPIIEQADPNGWFREAYPE